MKLSSLSPAIRLAPALLLLALTAGCFKSEISANLMFVKAVGIDYDEESKDYTVYVQMLDFSNEAKRESAPGSENATPIWTGKGKAKDINMAFSQMYESSQMRMSFTHVSALLLSRKAKEHMTSYDYREVLGAHPEVRFNIWIYGTQESLEDIFTAKGFFNLSDTTTLLHMPEESYKQQSLIQPVYLFRFLREVNHPALTAYVPELSLDKKSWKLMEKPSSKMKVDGACFYRGGKFAGMLTEEQLEGWTWMNPNMKNKLFMVKKGALDLGTAHMQAPKVKIGLKLDAQGRPRYHARVSIKGIQQTMMEPIAMKEMEEFAAGQIKRQIEAVYRNALAIEADPFGLEEIMYRKHPGRWKQLTRDGKEYMLRKDSFDVEVAVDLQTSGKYKPL
ncbi:MULTISPECIES: Ger(x)C family spore germination protein [unclassified Paenibacillus]|uniref:Ger(x)C family spore germination protein n=1 Tax=unclassified Paenibacillus TaxID=185978 RepID=UPI000955E26F|nr:MULTISPECIES: Ger(x)C family spore germination protein [unclassified Paenibacillus]ASS67006.1 Ger(x)C family spore germination protein [Paenibacillus sp. RUD330]SIR49222.1 germination protein, Ger(x)C family [Paenibacillus sp. RU4X]SIR58404.1 germination protein, Ger(x)C family [Paenibacillus sp. RU4T]